MNRTYVAAVDPPYPLLAPTRDRIRGDKTWSFVTLAAGHDAMVTAPAALASVLLAV